MTRNLLNYAPRVEAHPTFAVVDGVRYEGGLPEYQQRTGLTVRGSYGEFTVHPLTGAIVERFLDGDEYAGIARFDLPEYLAWHGATFPGYPLEEYDIDILSIGYWTADGGYEPAEVDYRAELASEV